VSPPGLIGVIMQELEYPVGPFVLGFILGPMGEDNLRHGLMITAGDPSPFFTRPIAFILCVFVVLSVVGPTKSGQRASAKIARLWRRNAR
jgi:putative tricarboxylic transport membrane protein